MFSKIISQLEISDYIQITILAALVWYSIETHLLRSWQKKQVQLSVFDIELERIRKTAESNGLRIPSVRDFPIILRKIYEIGEFNLKELYSPAYHQPLSLGQKIYIFIKNKINKN